MTPKPSATRGAPSAAGVAAEQQRKLIRRYHLEVALCVVASSGLALAWWRADPAAIPLWRPVAAWVLNAAIVAVWLTLGLRAYGTDGTDRIDRPDSGRGAALAYLGAMEAAIIGLTAVMGVLPAMVWAVGTAHDALMLLRTRWHRALAVTATVLPPIIWIAWVNIAATGWRASWLTVLFNAIMFAVLLPLSVGALASAMRESQRNAQLVDQLTAAQARLAASERAAGVAAERERMAGEIHDTLAQGFASVIIQAQAALGALHRDDDDGAATRLLTIEQTARDNLAEARNVVAAFAPVGLARRTFGDALEDLAQRWTSQTGIPAVVDLEATPSDAAQQDALLRITREALNNVAKHARADSVAITCAETTPGTFELAIIDDGVGPGHIAAASTSPNATGGYGIAGMRARAEAIGGTLTIHPGPESGTEVRVTLASKVDA